jgi:hypothetical protein
MKFGTTDIPAPAADVKVEVVEGELLLYHPGRTTAVYLNPPAAIIWKLCDGKRDVGEIIRLIGESYPESTPNLRDDVFATLAQLYDNHVVELGSR